MTRLMFGDIYKIIRVILTVPKCVSNLITVFDTRLSYP